MIKKCKNCGIDFETKRNTKQHCSNECFYEYRKRPEVLLKTIEKRKKFNLEKYGVDNPAKNEIIKEKTKQTNLEKYGVVSPTQNDEIRKKQISTCIRLYNNQNAFCNKEIQKKQKDTLYKNYGVKTPLENEFILNKFKQTCLDKYGTNNPSKNEIIKRKIENTTLKNHGVKYPVLNNEIKEKMITSHISNHYDEFLTNDKFKDILPLFSKNEYKGNVSYDTKYKFQCKKCKNIFEDTLLSGNIPLCNICYPPKCFYIENEISDYISTLLKSDEVILKNDRTVLNGKELDIYIPSKKLAIEFNGLFWHSEKGGNKNKVYHINKTNKCNEHEIKLIHIFEDEWRNKQKIVKSRLNNLFNKNITKIYARMCEIKEISTSESNEFLENNHIQGKDKSLIKLGSFYKNELISIMTFGKLRLALGNKHKSDKEYEMYRFCNKLNINIVGMASKFISYFIKKYNPSKIISYADRRWSNSSSFYSKIGFYLISTTPPNYWYINENYKQRFYRFNFRKDQLHKKLKTFNPDLSEWENMKMNGWDRIWDCGCLKYEFKP